MHSSMKKDVSMTVLVCGPGLRNRTGGNIQVVMNTTSKSFLKTFHSYTVQILLQIPNKHEYGPREKVPLRFWTRNRDFLKWRVIEKKKKKKEYIENTEESHRSAQSSTFEEMITGGTHPFSRPHPPHIIPPAFLLAIPLERFTV